MLHWFAQLTLGRFLALSALWALAVIVVLFGAAYLWIIPQFEREQFQFYSWSVDPVRLAVLLLAPPLAVVLLGVFARRFAAHRARDDRPHA